MSLSSKMRTSILTAAWLVLLGITGCTQPAPVAPTDGQGESGVAGRVWHDICASPGADDPLPDAPPAGCVEGSGALGYSANGRLDQNEAGIGGVEVQLGQGACPSFGFATTLTAPDGLFLFASLEPGTYCVTIDPDGGINAGLLPPGLWTYPGASPPQGIVSTQVDIGEDEVKADVYFAWDFELLPPYEPAVTPEPPTSTLTELDAVPSATMTPEATPTATVSPTPELSPTATFSAEDPRSSLNNPTWIDHFEDQSDWALYSDDHARFEIVDDGLNMTAFKPDFFNSWVLSWRKAEDQYVEATGTFGTCSGRDAYGLMIRSTGGDLGYIGYLFGISCDGRYSLRSWNGESMSNIIGWTTDDAIHSGSDQVNRIGVWAQGSEISLYANGEFLTQVTDDSHQTEGLFGVFISSAQTADFSILVEEFAFWNLD